MKRSFAKKLTASYLLIVAVTLLITGVYLTPRLKANFLINLEQSLSAQALLMRDLAVPLLPRSAPDALHTLAHHLREEMGCRVTIVRADGKVLGDSDLSGDELGTMDNHGNRPEIQKALASGTGEAVRYSRTLKEDMLYVAVPIFRTSPRASRTPLLIGEGDFKVLPSPIGRGSDAVRGEVHPWGVLRVALPLTEVDRRVTAFQGDLLKAGAVAFFIAWLVALVVARRTSRPLGALTETAQAIGEGRYPRDVAVTTTDEFGQLARAFSEMSTRIEEKVGELSQERTQLAAILSALVEGVVAVDHQGHVLFLNPAAEQLFAVKSREAMGRPVLEVLRHNAFHGVMQETLQRRQAVAQEIEIHSPRERILTVQALPVSYGENRTGVLAALHDITELRKLERVRQEFVANVSHELKTPLTSIKGYVETLLQGAIDDKKHNREFLEIIEQNARHLSLLIDDVLDLSAIEAKRIEYRFDAVALDDVTERLIKGLAPMAKAKNVKILNTLSEKLPKVRADRDKLAQVLMNLLDNAIKFNKPDGEIRISAETQGGHVAISIKDTGAGVLPDDLPRIFERFYRADKAHSREIEGTGLGLAIVKHLVEAHQGTINVDSVFGQGSTFTFTLPKA